jgi:C1A family cysteine protease
MLKYLLLFCFVTNAFSNLIGGNTDEYNNYLHTYNKNYNYTPEYWGHFYEYKINLDKITDHNSKNLSWKMGVNNFTDISNGTFKSIYLMAKPISHRIYGDNSLPFTQNPEIILPDAIDWRSENLVTNIKDQGQCGSCWVFSAVGSLEGVYAKKTNNLVSLSEQNLVDCGQNFNCNEWMSSVLEYVFYNHGLDTETSYVKDCVCHYKKNTNGVKIKNITNITQGDVDALLYALATVGPISVAIDASFDFQNYKSGIYTSTSCNKEILNHGVLVVGYGVTSKDKKYYIIKNSWGTSWGMDGYAYWDRDTPDMCGIAQSATFPTL